MTGNKGWEDTRVHEGALLRLQDPGISGGAEAARNGLGMRGLALHVEVRSLDVAKGEATVAILGHDGKPMKRRDEPLLHAYLPYIKQGGTSNRAAGYERRSHRKLPAYEELDQEWTAVVACDTYRVLHVFDTWPWNGLLVGDEIEFAAPPLGANTSTDWTGTVTGLDPAGQVLSVSVTDSHTGQHAEQFRYEKTSLGKNRGDTRNL